MKIYSLKEHTNASFLSSLTDIDLEEKLKSLEEERGDIESEIRSIRTILKDRRDGEHENLTRTFPESVFDLSKNQFDVVFKHNHHITERQLDVSNKYATQFRGLYISGFNPQTEQACFAITEGYIKDVSSFKKSLNFVLSNLNKTEGDEGQFVLIKVLGNRHSIYIRFYSRNRIVIHEGSFKTREVKSIDELIGFLPNLLNDNNDGEY